MAWTLNPSTVPQYGGATAVSAMNNAQAAAYLFTDVSLGAIPQYASSGQMGLLRLISDGRNRSDQDHGDAQYLRNKIGIGQGGA